MSESSRRQIIAAGLNALTSKPFGKVSKIASLLSPEPPAPSRAPVANRTDNEKLWYHTPADEWVEALPIGNGRIGAMIFGGIPTERIQLNEATVWAGGPHDYDNPDALGALPEIRRLIFEGKIKEAQDLANAKFMSKPIGQLQYQTVGDLTITFDSVDSTVANYRRELDLADAVHHVSYEQDGVAIHRETFASHPDKVLVTRIHVNHPNRLNCHIHFNSPQKSSVYSKGHDLILTGTGSDSEGIKGEVQFTAIASASVDYGSITATSDSLQINGATTLTIVVSIATNVINYHDLTADPTTLAYELIEKAVALPYDALKKRHLDDYRHIFGRVHFHLIAPSPSGSTEERILAFQQDHDPTLPVLYFNYGRYLLISSSREGGRAATLQGLWNDSLTPPWGSKYTTNINTEMNYWPVETCNLPECHLPLFDLIKDISVTGAKTAKVHYGAGGWVLHHNTDQWRGTAPIDGAAWGIWQTGGAWLSTHLWEHHRFNPKSDRLKEHYPMLKGAAEFFVDALVTHPEKGCLVTCPSASPENSHHPGEGLCAGPTMDIAIVRDLFEACIQASKTLDVDIDFRQTLESMKSKLPPLQIGRHGQLQEWLDDWDEFAPEQHHRHVSHLYALYPSHQINPKTTPELFAAAKKSLEFRGDEGTGWSLAWKINLWARLLDGNHAYRLVKDALRPVGSKHIGYSGGGGAYPNLFDAHPPFQIDGNFGFASGVAEMMLQSHLGELHLLPALPSIWASGSISGLRARGGYTVNLNWVKGRLTLAVIHADQKGSISVRYGDQAREVHFEAGQTQHVTF